MTQTFSVKSSKQTELIDITRPVQEAVQKAGVKEGLCVIFTPHTTAAVTINENAKSRRVGGPVEKDLGRHRLRIDSGCSKSNKNLIFIDYESFP